MHLKAAPIRSRSQPEQMISSSARALWPRNGWLWLGCLTDGFLEAIVAKIILFVFVFVIYSENSKMTFDCESSSGWE